MQKEGSQRNRFRLGGWVSEREKGIKMKPDSLKRGKEIAHSCVSNTQDEVQMLFGGVW